MPNRPLTNEQIVKRLMNSTAGPLAQAVVMTALEKYLNSAASQTKVEDLYYLSMESWVRVSRQLSKELAKMRGQIEPKFPECLVVDSQGDVIATIAGDLE